MLEFETPSVIQVVGVSLSYPRHRRYILWDFMLDVVYGSHLAVRQCQFICPVFSAVGTLMHVLS